jgi:hypothetical protein
MAVKNPDLIPLFEEIKNLMKVYEKHFDIKEGEGAYNLIYKGNVEVGKYVRDEVYFASALIQKNFVGFYFMPQYTTGYTPEYFSGSNMLKVLKGKSCYNVSEKTFKEEFKVELVEALKKGFETYKKKGWIK